MWVQGPGTEPWEVYVVKADSATFTELTADAEAAATSGGCC